MKRNRIISLLLLLIMMIQPLTFAEETAETDGVLLASSLDIRCGSGGRLRVGNDGFYYMDKGMEGSFLECTIPFEEKGTYHIYATVQTGPKFGIVQMAVGSEDVGERKNLYMSNAATTEIEFGYAKVDKAGNQRLRFITKSISGDNGGFAFALKSLRIVKESVAISNKGYKLGNIFFSDEEVKFDLEFANMTENELTAEVSFTAVGTEKAVATGTPIELKLKGAETFLHKLVMPVTVMDLYELKIHVNIPGMENFEKIINFSYVEARREELKDDDSDGIFGVCTHFSQKKGDITKNFQLMKNSGVKWIRDEYGWGTVEATKGTYTFPPELDAYVDEALRNGIKPLIILDYGNRNYDGGNAPYTDEGRKGYANYAKAMAEHFKGKVEAFEIWNEWNGGMGNPHRHSAAVYAQMLKVVYPAIKSVDPNIKVVAGSTITVGTDFFTLLFESGGYDYLDAISYHPYCMPTNPDIKNYQGNIEDNISINSNLMRQYGGVKPIWITELGWFGGTDPRSVSPKMQAAFMTRMYILAMAYNAEKVFWYDFQDDGIRAEDSEENYGIIKCWTGREIPWEAKPAYLAYSALTNKMQGATLHKEYRLNHDMRAYHFYRDSDDTEIIAMWNINGTVELNLSGNTSKMQMYDMMGNPIEVSRLSETPVYLVGKKGDFDPADLEATKRIKATAVFGTDYTFNGLRTSYDAVVDKKSDLLCLTLGEETGINSLDFEVDDTYIYGGINPVELSIKYLDAGSGGFYLQYDSPEGKTKTDEIVLGDTSKWKTASITIENARFIDKNGADFSIELTDPKKPVSFSEVILQKRKVEDFSQANAVLSDILIFNNLSVRFGDNAPGWTYVEKGGRVGIYSDNKKESIYLYCDVADELIYDGVNHVKVNITYFDEGEGSFAIAYDSQEAAYKSTDPVYLENTKEWRTATFELTDARFANRASRSDFRIALWTNGMGMSKENVCFGNVSVEKIDDKKKKVVVYHDIIGHWAEDRINQMAKLEIVSGYSDDTFKPNENVTTEEFIKMLISAMGLKTAKAEGKWSEPYINKALDLGIINAGEFSDYTKKITRGEIARMLVRVAGTRQLEEKDRPKFNDTVPADMKEYIDQAYNLRLMSGYEDHTIRVHDLATRAESTVLIEKLLSAM